MCALLCRLGMYTVVSPQHLTPQLYPVSVSSHPPFTMLVPLVGQGDLQARTPSLRRGISQHHLQSRVGPQAVSWQGVRM